MTATPARDALAERLHAIDCGCGDGLADNGDSYVEMVDDLLANPSDVIAALVEAGYQPTDDDLRAMGGTKGAVSTHAVVWLFPKEATEAAPYLGTVSGYQTEEDPDE